MNMPDTLEESNTRDLNEPVGEVVSEETERTTSVIQMIDKEFSSTAIIKSIPKGDGQISIDELFAAYTHDLPPGIRARYRQVLYKLCRHYMLLPSTMRVTVSYYQPNRPVAGGGFGYVYKGLKPRGCEVAIKVIKTHPNDDEQKQREKIGKFCKEAIMWKALTHPNVLSLTGAMLSENGEIELISDWMDNGDINKFVKNSPRDLNLIPLLRGVARGLTYIHSQDLIHGDLKGANILVDQSGNALLADFGMATNIDPGSYLSSTLNEKGGTTRWMSPELFDPERFGCETVALTKASDCYAFAMVIYEVISGHLPFQGCVAHNVPTKVMDGEHPVQETGFSDAIWKILESCWAGLPCNRPSVNDVLQRLEGVPHVSRPSSPANEGTAPSSDISVIVISASDGR